MDLKVIGTGSAGNAYLLQQGRDALLLDAGLRWSDILKELPNGLRDIHACLITHEHKDHCKAVPQLLKYGVQTMMSAGTWEAIRHEGLKRCNNLHTTFAGDVMVFGMFTVMGVRVMHDATEPFGYIIRHEGTKETVLYATDTYLLPNRYPGINHWIVECNYTTEKAQELLTSPEKAPLYDRLMRSHMSLERLVTALEANDLTHTRTIVLIHISNDRGDSPLMEQTVKRATGIRTIAAKNGMEIQLGDCPF